MSRELAPFDKSLSAFKQPWSFSKRLQLEIVVLQVRQMAADSS